MLTSFTKEGDEIRELFRALLLKGKRDVRSNKSPSPLPFSFLPPVGDQGAI